MTPEDLDNAIPEVLNHPGNVYGLASRALAAAQDEAKKWRIRAEDAEKNLEELNEKWEEDQRKISQLVRVSDIHNQIIEQKDLAIAAYKNMVEDLQGSGIVGRQSEEIVALQEKLKFALSFVPHGDCDTFAFQNGDEAEYGSLTQYSEIQLDYFCQALPLAMSCINRLKAIGASGTMHIIGACQHAIEKVHERTQVGEEVCQFTGQMRKRPSWLQEEEDDGQS